MEYKLLSGSKIDRKKPTQDVSNAPQAEGPGVLSRLGYSALQGLEAPGRALDALLGLFGEQPLMRSSVSEEFRKYLGAQPEQLEPQNILESYGQRFLKQAPIAGLFGPAALGSTAIGSAFGAGLERLGAPPLVQDIGQLAGELGTGLLRGKIPLRTLGRKQTTAYEAAEKAVGAELPKTPAFPIFNRITQVEKNLVTETNQKVKDIVGSALDTVKKNIETLESGIETISPQKALELRKNIYKDISQLKGPLKRAYPYLKELPEGINDFFAWYATENPEFYNHLSQADKYTQLKHIYSWVEDSLDKLPSFGGVKGIVKKTLGKYTLGGAERFARRLIKHPGTMLEHYFDMARTLSRALTSPGITSTPSLLLNNVNEFAQAFEEEKPARKEIKEYPGIKLLSGQRIYR